jgi:hypothetical protein
MNNPNTANPLTPTAADAVAARFVDDQLRNAQASLRRTRGWCLGSMLLVSAYMSFITWTLQTRLLEPKAAADLATAYVSAFVDEQGNAVAKQLVEQVPGYIAGLPDRFLGELPTVREDLEKQLDFVLSAVARDVSTQMGEHLDEYLVDNREQIKEFLSAAQEPQFVEKFGEQLEQEILSYFKLPGEDGQSALDKLQQIATGLNTVEARLHRLASAPDLTPEEQTLRQLIGFTLRVGKAKA